MLVYTRNLSTQKNGDRDMEDKLQAYLAYASQQKVQFFPTQNTRSNLVD